MARSQADMIKIGVAVVALVGAGFLLLYQFTDIFRGGPPQRPKISTEKQQKIDEEFKEQERIQRELEEKGEIQIGGA